MGAGSSRQRHNDRGGLSSNTRWSREPEGASGAPRREPEDHFEVEEAVHGRGPSNRPEAAKTPRFFSWTRKPSSSPFDGTLCCRSTIAFMAYRRRFSI